MVFIALKIVKKSLADALGAPQISGGFPNVNRKGPNPRQRAQATIKGLLKFFKNKIIKHY